MQSAVERAARAAKAASNETLGGILPEWENTDPKNKEEWRTIARAVLQAIREPDPRMLMDVPPTSRKWAAEWFSRIIDRALEER